MLRWYTWLNDVPKGCKKWWNYFFLLWVRFYYTFFHFFKVKFICTFMDGQSVKCVMHTLKFFFFIPIWWNLFEVVVQLNMYYYFTKFRQILYIFASLERQSSPATKWMDHPFNLLYITPLTQCSTELGRFRNSSEECSDIFWGTEVLI